MNEEYKQKVKAFMEVHIPFNAFLGIMIQKLDNGTATLYLPFKDDFVGDPFRPALHGGVISTLIDTCGGAAVFSAINRNDRVSTVDLRVDYLLPGELQDLWCDACVVRLGNRVAVTEMKAFHPGSEKKIVATGRGVYNIYRGD